MKKRNLTIIASSCTSALFAIVFLSSCGGKETVYVWSIKDIVSFSVFLVLLLVFFLWFIYTWLSDEIDQWKWERKLKVIKEQPQQEVHDTQNSSAHTRFLKNTSLKKVTTLEGTFHKITTKRRDGNTTRLVDNAIQILFSGSICVVLDHHEIGRSYNANRHLFECILKRLRTEHRWLFEQNKIKFDKDKLEIMIVSHLHNKKA